MKKLCRNCTHCTQTAEGVLHCDLSDTDLSFDASPFDLPDCEAGSCWVKRKRARLSHEEISRIRSESGRKGGLAKGYGHGSIPVRQMSVRHFDHAVFANFAHKKSISIAEAMHKLAATLIRNQPDLKPKSWMD